MPEDRSARPDDSPTEAVVWRPGAALTVTAPRAQAGRAAAVDPRGTTVGRDATSDLALASDYIDRHHAVVRFDGHEWVVEDLGSTSGTLLNGAAVIGSCPLRHGDRLTFADVDVAFQLTGGEPASPGPSRPTAAGAGPFGVPTETLGPGPEGQQRSLRQDLHQAPGFSATALVLAVLGAMVGTVLTGVVGAGPWGTLAGAAIGPVVTTTFTTKRAGEKGRVRAAAIIILSAGALLITWAGVGLADQAAGRSIIPGTADRRSTFPGPAAAPAPAPATPTPQSQPPTSGQPSTTAETVGPGARANPAELDCGTATIDGGSATCPPLMIENSGTEVLRITSVEVTGDASGDFVPNGCEGASVAPGGSCAITVTFAPRSTLATQGTSERRATLVVHQNIPPPDTGTQVRLTGVGE